MMYQSSLSLTEHVSSWDDPQPSEKYCDIADHMDADCRTRLTTGARAPYYFKKNIIYCYDSILLRS